MNTTFNNFGTALLFLSVTMVLFAPRKWALLCMVMGFLYITQGQRFVIFGLNVFANRIIEVAGIFRVMFKNELRIKNLTKIDRIFIFLYIYTLTVYLIRSIDPKNYEFGVTLDAILAYISFRGLIQNNEDLNWLLKSMIVLLVPYAIILLIERYAGVNYFASMGGIIEYALYRDGRPRCWGTFRHPVSLGTFGASFFPLYLGMFFGRDNRLLATFGSVLCVGIVIASNSGGPLSAFLMGVVGWFLWLLRYRMYLIRRSISGLVVILGLLMKAPVWFLLARVSNITGGDGYHRAYLIDIAIRNIGKWWLCGMQYSDTHGWFPYTSASMEGVDMTNHYLSFALTSGLGALALFIYLLVTAFSSLGKTMSDVRGQIGSSPKTECTLWGLGVALTVHITTWLGFSYFDQMNMFWFMQIASISSLTQSLYNTVTPQTELDY